MCCEMLLANLVAFEIEFDSREPPEEGRGMDFPRNLASLAVCTQITAMLHVGNMIELVHAKLTHTYDAARRLSGMPRGLCYVMFSEFQIC